MNALIVRDLRILANDDQILIHNIWKLVHVVKLDRTKFKHFETDVLLLKANL